MKPLVILFSVIQLLIIFKSNLIQAQPGTLDTTFNASGSLGIYAVAVQSDDKVIIGGGFTSINLTSRNKVARLNKNGSIDASFNAPSIFNTSVYTVSVQQDGKYIVGGTAPYLVRLNNNGTIDNSFVTSPGNIIRTSLIQHDGKILIGGDFTNFNGDLRNYLNRINSDGSNDTTFNIGLGFDNAVACISQQSDGKILVGGRFNNFNGISTNKIVRLNTDGSFDSTFQIGSTLNGHVYSVSLYGNKIYLGGYFNGLGKNYIIRLNDNGSVDSSFNSGFGFDSGVRNVEIQIDGKIIVSGEFTIYNGIPRSRIARLLPNGELDLTFNPGTGFNNVVFSSAQQSDGKIILVGNFSRYNSTNRNMIARINTNNYNVVGSVFLDLNNNCVKNNNEIGLSGRVAIILPGNITIQTNHLGNWYKDSLPSGNYTITIDTSNSNWIPTCPITQSFTVVHPDSFVHAPDFGFISAYPCASPDVSIVMPTMRRGFSNQQIYVQACNENTATGVLDSAFTIVTLPVQITVQNATLPYTSLGNNQYRFYIGDLNPGQCVNFTISATVTTQAIANQTLCLNAELFPQADCVFDSIPTPYDYRPSGFVSPCSLPWDGSSLRVEGECVGDSVRFVIYNTGEFGGGDMDCFAPVRVYVDGQWVMLDSIRIVGGDSVIYMLAGTGGTIRLEADQHPLHPGNSHPNANVENCGNGTWTPGIINTMPQDDADPIIDIYCGQVTAPTDPNDKTGFPLGVGTTHAIRQNQQIEYLIRFQNVGTDTAFNVVIRDTLSTDFNIFTVQSEVASHPYEFRMYGPRELEWRFDNIMLPDSNTNLAASQGFVKFTVQQNPDLPIGTVIENSAAIYFDFEAPVITNTYFHTISDFTIQVNTEKIENFENTKVSVIPNPFSSSALLKLEGLENTENLVLEIFSLNGQRIQYLNNSQNGQFQLSRSEMVQGIYFFTIRQKGLVVARGKMVVE
jgi:uncharacterized delta-60 repeat protein/uncharacterized repeat protein (TIGR01451 family)